MTAGAACAPLGLAPVCAGLVSGILTGITSGNLGLALRAGFLTAVTVGSFQAVGQLTAGNFAAKIMGHAVVGCMTAMASGGRCGRGALSAASGAAATPFGLLGASIVGGLTSVATGGKFANGAVTAAFGYLFNACGKDPWGCLKQGTGVGLLVGTTIAVAETAGTGGLGAPAAPIIMGATMLVYATAGAVVDVGAMIYDSLSSGSREYNTLNSEDAPKPPELDPTGKVHGNIPTSIPSNWTEEQLRELEQDLQTSLGNRQREQEQLGEGGSHRERMRQERDLLRQIQKQLGGS